MRFVARQKPEEAQRLAYWRKRQGLTQATLADRLGTTRDVVARWEIGAPIPPYHADKLRELGYTFEEPLPGAERIRITKQSARLLLTILSDCTISPEIRESARAELWKAFHLDSEAEF